MARLLVILAILGILTGFCGWLYKSGYSAGEDSMESFWQQRYINDKKVAEKRSQDAQNRLTAQYQEQYNEMQSINDTLVADLDRVRDSYNSLPTPTTTASESSCGQELPRRSAEDFTKLGAECERMRANLKTHYQYVDEVMGLYQ